MDTASSATAEQTRRARPRRIKTLDFIVQNSLISIARKDFENVVEILKLDQFIG